MNPKNTITAIGQIGITVDDVDKALSFYSDVLGLQFLFSPSGDLAFLACGPTRIMLTTPKGAGEVGKNSIVYFNVSRIEEYFMRVVSMGARPEREPQLAAKMKDHDLWIGFLKDPDGNLVGVMEEKLLTE